MPDPSEVVQNARTVTLSDGSVWTYHPGCKHEASGIVFDLWTSDRCQYAQMLPSVEGFALTASDHRKIADILDAACPTSESPAEGNR